MTSNKPRVIKSYEKLSDDIIEQIKLVYPDGFSHHLIKFTDKEGKRVTALPFETDEKYYLIKMTVEKAIEIIEEDDDYNDEGYLKSDSKEAYNEKHADVDYLADQIKEEEPDDYKRDD